MSFLSNFKIRTKILIALLPLLLMMLAAGLYSSIEMKEIDTQYSRLIDKELAAEQALTLARAHNNRFGLLLYEEIAETDANQTRITDAELNQTAEDFRAAANEAKRKSPSLADALDPIILSFDRIVAATNPVRAAALSGDKQKALREMREVVEPEYLRTRQALTNLSSTLDRRVAEESDRLTE